MSRKFQTGLVSILLLLGISCTKENTNSPSRNSVQATDESQTADALAPGVNGQWTLNWDWFCTGFPGSVGMTVKKTGNWYNDFGENGEWISGDDLFVFQYKGLHTIYAGHTRHGGIDGVQGEFKASNASGCFTMTKALLTGLAADGKLNNQLLPGGKQYIEPLSSTKKLSSSTETTDAIKLSGGDETSDFGTNGSWTLYFSWGCTGTYASVSMTVNKDGTFSDGAGDTGQWVKGDGIFLFRFDLFKTGYAGRMRSGQIDGISGEFNGTGSQGCFYMTKTVFSGPALKKGQQLPTGKIY